MTNPTNQASGVAEPDEERYCLGCQKLGHFTTDCHSTHGLNTPADRELFRLTCSDYASRAALATKPAAPPVVQPASPAVEVASKRGYGPLWPNGDRGRGDLSADDDPWAATPPAPAAVTEVASDERLTVAAIAMATKTKMIPLMHAIKDAGEGEVTANQKLTMDQALQAISSLVARHPAVAVPGSLTDEDAVRDALQQMVDAFSPYAWTNPESRRDALNNAERALATTSTAAQPGDAS